jgi:hypothetical protein
MTASRIFTSACLLAASLGLPGVGRAQPATMTTPVLTRETAVRQALADNPTLATVRKQHGYAEAALIIARTYPYNPVYTGYFANNTGPARADITNRLFL